MSHLTKLCIVLSLYASSLNAAISPHIERWLTTQGTPVVFYQAMDIPMLNIQIAFHAGAAYDGSQFGLSALCTRLLNQGNAGFDASAIANQLADVGAQYSSENTQDSLILNLKTLSEPRARTQALNTLKRIIGHPDFLETAFNREKNQQRLSLRHTEESPDDMAG